MNYCKTCKYWVPYANELPKVHAASDKLKGGFCHNEKITEDFGEYRRDTLVYPYQEGAEHFWTGPEFGCINYVNS